MWDGLSLGTTVSIAFSSEVDTGSREENASKQKLPAGQKEKGASRRLHLHPY